jgi:hypothetical protein
LVKIRNRQIERASVISTTFVFSMGTMFAELRKVGKEVEAEV